MQPAETRWGFRSLHNVEIVGTTKNAIRIDGSYGMVNTWCRDPAGRPCTATTCRRPSVVDNITMSNIAVYNANLSIHLAGALDVPATRISFHNVTFVCDGAAPSPTGPHRCSDANLVAECYGGVRGSAAGVMPPQVMGKCPLN